MSIFVIHNSHELHQLKKSLLLLRGDMTTYRHYHSNQNRRIIVIFAVPVSHCGELALFIVDFSGKLPKYVDADLRLLSIHS